MPTAVRKVGAQRVALNCAARLPKPDFSSPSGEPPCRRPPATAPIRYHCPSDQPRRRSSGSVDGLTGRRAPCRAEDAERCNRWNTTARSCRKSWAMTAPATSARRSGGRFTSPSSKPSRSVTNSTAWRLAIRCRLSSSSSAETVSTKSVNSTTRPRRFRRTFSSARPRVSSRQGHRRCRPSTAATGRGGNARAGERRAAPPHIEGIAADEILARQRHPGSARAALTAWSRRAMPPSGSDMDSRCRGDDLVVAFGAFLAQRLAVAGRPLPVHEAAVEAGGQSRSAVELGAFPAAAGPDATGRRGSGTAGHALPRAGWERRRRAGSGGWRRTSCTSPSGPCRQATGPFTARAAPQRLQRQQSAPPCRATSRRGHLAGSAGPACSTGPHRRRPGKPGRRQHRDGGASIADENRSAPRHRLAGAGAAGRAQHQWRRQRAPAGRSQGEGQRARILHRSGSAGGCRRRDQHARRVGRIIAAPPSGRVSPITVSP